MFKKILEITKYFTGDGKKIKSEGKAFLSCLEYKDEGYYIAHCLEFDIVAQGNTPEEARNNLADLIREQITFASEQDIEEKILFKPAPQRYWELWHKLRNRHARYFLSRHPRITPHDILKSSEWVNAHV